VLTVSCFLEIYCTKKDISVFFYMSHFSKNVSGVMFCFLLFIDIFLDAFSGLSGVLLQMSWDSLVYKE